MNNRNFSLTDMPVRVTAAALIVAAVLFVCLVPGARAQSNDICLTCHGQEGMEGEDGESIYVNPEVYSNSIHGRNELDCVMCHQELSGVEDYPHKTDIVPADCSLCHDGAAEKYYKGHHGRTRKAGNEDSPACRDCHGKHDILPSDNPESKTSPFNVPKVCDSCHADPELVARNGLKSIKFVKSYDTGVHGEALRKSGLVSSAVCTSCHGAHEIYPAENPESKINKSNVPKTCGGCHVGVYRDYVKSVHGKDYLKGIKDVPVCTDCHGEHEIKSSEDRESKVYPTKVGQTCSRCHDNAELVRRFGLPPDRLRTYRGTYHGVASMSGNTRVANCASCHGVHKIQPSSNPESRIHPDNLPDTCGKPECHESRLENVVKGKVHIIKTREDNVWAYIVSSVYKILISLTIGGFLIFIAVDLYARYRRKKRAQRANKGE